MPLSLRHKFTRLPKRLPVGSTLVIEGRTVAGNGKKTPHFQILSRFILLPGGRRIELGGDSSGGSARNRRARERNQPAQPQRRSGGTKKIIAGRGTTLRQCR